MNEWTLLTYVLAGGLGAIVFLKLVCDEIVIKNRILIMRVEALEEEQGKARTQPEASAQTDEAGAGVETAKPAA